MGIGRSEKASSHGRRVRDPANFFHMNQNIGIA
jgi:hypothetical protein